MTSLGPAVERPAAARNLEPWLGLTPYCESDSELFFGREKEAREIFRRIESNVLTVVFGPSGTGKTSLLNAGLSPLLREANFLPVGIRLDHSSESGDHIRDIKRAIARELSHSGIEEASIAPAQTPAAEETLWEYLHRADFWSKANRPVTPVLLFDQFEEIFTLGADRPATRAFLRELADLVENYVPDSVRARLERGHAKLNFPYDRQHYKVLLSLREDFVCRLDTLRKAMPSVMQNRFVLERMKGQQALDAVIKPGRGIVSETVARRIIHVVAAANEHSSEECAEVDFNCLSIEPALLSVVCRELNARRIRAGRSTITVEDVVAGEGDILTDFYERSFEGLRIQARIFVEGRLLTASGFRCTVPLEDAEITVEEVNCLVDKRLIRREERLGIPHLELTHDVLTKVVRKSRDARRERERREKEEQERTKVEEQRKQKLQQARRLVFLFSSLTAIFLVLGIAAIFLWLSARKARADAESAHAKTEAALSTVVDLGEAFGDEAKPLVFEAFASDLTEFADIPFIAGRVQLFKGLAALASAREAGQGSAGQAPDKDLAANLSAQALKYFEQYLNLAQTGLNSATAFKRDLWTREVGKAQRAIGDVNRYLGNSVEAQASYSLALQQFDYLESHRTTESLEDSTLDLADIYVRMAEASLDRNDNKGAIEFCQTALTALRKHYQNIDQNTHPDVREAFGKVSNELLKARSIKQGPDLVPADWVQAYIGASQSRNVSTLRPFFDDTVSPYFALPSADWTTIARDKEYFFTRFPVINYTLVGQPEQKVLADGQRVVDFDQQYSTVRADGKTAKGVSHLTLQLRFAGGQWKISGIHERIVAR